MAPDRSSEEGAAVFWRPPEHALPAGVWFGVTTRLGGVSAGPYASLNLGLGVGDREEAVLENRRRMRRAAGAPEGAPLLLRQVHGARIATPPEAGARADGFLARRGDPWVGVSVADCAPVAIVAEDGTAGALLHSGWRGSRDGIAVRAVERLARLGVRPSALRAAIGPCIHRCCYPVGPDVASAVPAIHLAAHPSGRIALDLPGLIAASLREAGLDGALVWVAPECTSCARDRFFSHRRDRGLTGRHWALLRLPPAGP